MERSYNRSNCLDCVVLREEISCDRATSCRRYFGLQVRCYTHWCKPTDFPPDGRMRHYDRQCNRGWVDSFTNRWMVVPTVRNSGCLSRGLLELHRPPGTAQISRSMGHALAPSQRGDAEHNYRR